MVGRNFDNFEKNIILTNKEFLKNYASLPNALEAGGKPSTWFPERTRIGFYARKHARTLQSYENMNFKCFSSIILLHSLIFS